MRKKYFETVKTAINSKDSQDFYILFTNLYSWITDISNDITKYFFET